MNLRVLPASGFSLPLLTQQLQWMPLGPLLPQRQLMELRLPLRQLLKLCQLVHLQQRAMHAMAVLAQPLTRFRQRQRRHRRAR